MLDALLIKETQEFDVLEAYFLQALTWSLGACLLEESQIKFDAYVKRLASLTTADDENTPAKAGKQRKKNILTFYDKKKIMEELYLVLIIRSVNTT